MPATPLTRPVTYLRVVFLLLGAALAVSLALLDVTLIVLLRDAGLPVAVELPVMVVIVAAPPVLLGLMAPARQVEAVAAESLLGVRFPDGAPGPAHSVEQRVRAAVWFLLHVFAGGVVGLGAAVMVPLAPTLVAAPFTRPAGYRVLSLDWLRTTGGWTDLWLPVAGVLGLVALPALAAGLGALLARAAPALLGPSYAERLHRLEDETARLAERNRIARELHDSVGHALSLVTVQAGAARKVLDRDREFAARALHAIEEAARVATADLDHALGLLRDGGAGRRPVPDLGSLPALLSATRAAGLQVTADVDGDLSGLPGVVSREAYRIIQEGLTNALRHASDRTASLRVTRSPGRLRVTVGNPATPGRAARRGRGLRGIEERVYALGGTVAVSGPVLKSVDNSVDGFRLAVDLPVEDVR